MVTVKRLGLPTQPYLADQVSCIRTGEFCRFSAQPFSLFTTEGKVTFDAGDKKVVRDFSVRSILGSVDVPATLCTSSSSVTVQLIDDESRLLDSKVVSVQ